VAGQEDEPSVLLVQTRVDPERQHHGAEATRIAALADKRHPLIVLELEA
jgi:hypothetical protein